MTRNQDSELLHKKLIRAMVNKIESEGYHSIKADHIDYKDGSPEKYGGHVPDITAKKNSHTTIVIEAETPDSIDDDQTKEQLQVLSNIPNTKFWIIVPGEIVNKLKQNLKKWNIYYDTIFSLSA